MILLPIVILAILAMALLLRPWPFFIEPEEPRRYLESNVAVEFAKWVERQALARGLDVRGVARTVSLECHKCKKASNYFVYPDEVCERCWRASLKQVQIPVKERRH